MAKPILLVHVRHDYPSDEGKLLSKSLGLAVKEEYHVIVVNTLLSDAQATFQVLNAESVPESTIEEIKKAICS